MPFFGVEYETHKQNPKKSQDNPKKRLLMCFASIGGIRIKPASFPGQQHDTEYGCAKVPAHDGSDLRSRLEVQKTFCFWAFFK